MIFRKKAKFEINLINLNALIPNISTQTNIDSNQTIFSDLTNLELDGSSFEKHQNHDTIQDDQYKNNIDEYNNIIDRLYMVWTRYKS